MKQSARRRAGSTETRRAAVERTAQQLWTASANPDGPGLLLRGLEYQPIDRDALDPLVLDHVLCLGRLAYRAADRLRHHPDPGVRRAAALLAARSHPILAAFDA